MLFNIFAVIMILSKLNECLIFEIIKTDVVSLQQMCY